jgi:SAM-dependent methyltransferase
MNQFIRGTARAVIESFALPEPVCEIGSYQVAGQEDLINLRSHFSNQEYLGIDFRDGPGVDLVANVEKLPLPDASVGTVIALSVFEHVEHFWHGFEEVFRVLRPDGVFIVSCPFYFHIHGYPSDYWRFTPAAFDRLLDRYPTRLIGWHGAERRPADVWAVGFREAAVVPSKADLADYQDRMNRYAVEPMSLLRKVRYGLGRMVAGRRPFAPYLDRTKWKMQFHQADATQHHLPELQPGTAAAIRKDAA